MVMFKNVRFLTKEELHRVAQPELDSIDKLFISGGEVAKEVQTTKHLDSFVYRSLETVEDVVSLKKSLLFNNLTTNT